MKSSSHLPLNLQCAQLIQDVKQIKKDNSKHDRHNSLTEQQQLRQVLYANDYPESCVKPTHSASSTQLQFSKPSAISHKRQVLHEIAKIKQLRDPIADYRQFFKANNTSIPETQSNAHNITFQADKQHNSSLMGRRSSSTALQHINQELPPSSEAVRGVTCNTVDQPCSILKKGRYTSELKLLVQERRRLVQARWF